MMWPFKWKLSAYTFTRCYLFLKILENEICKFGRNLPLATFGSERVKRASTGSQITITRPYSLWGLRNYLWMTKLQLRVTKNKLLKAVRLTSFQKPQLKSVSICSTFSIRASLNFVFAELIVPSCKVLSDRFYVSLNLVTVPIVWILINFVTQLFKSNIW